jgi:hypothetical protein
LAESDDRSLRSRGSAWVGANRASVAATAAAGGINAAADGGWFGVFVGGRAANCAAGAASRRLVFHEVSIATVVVNAGAESSVDFIRLVERTVAGIGTRQTASGTAASRCSGHINGSTGTAGSTARFIGVALVGAQSCTARNGLIIRTDAGNYFIAIWHVYLLKSWLKTSRGR